MIKNSFIWKYVKNYKFNSIFVKNLITLLLLELIPVSAALYLSYFSYTKLYESEVQKQNQVQLSQFVTLADQIFYDTSRQLGGMSLSRDVELFLYSEPKNEMPMYNVKNIQQLEKMQTLGTEFIDSVYIYAYKSNQVISNTAITPLEIFKDKELIYSYMEEKDNMTYPKMKVSLGHDSDKEKVYLSLYYDIYFGNGQKGVAIANIDPNEFGEKIESNKEAEFYIIENDTILYASRKDLLGQSIKNAEKKITVLDEGVYLSGDINYAVQKSEDTQLMYISVFPEIEYPKHLEEYVQTLQILLMILVFLSTLLCFFISIRMFKPLEEILLKCEGSGLFSYEVDNTDKRMDELKYIVNTIDNTEKDKSRIEMELEKRMQMLKKAQTVALQAQINPHFINNTLQTMNGLAMLKFGAENEISSVANALSGMLRLSLENTDNIIPIQQEIEHCQLYLEIQKKRYKDKFDVKWDVSDEICRCKTVKIILQPIVENCIYHGIKPMSGKGTIQILGRQQNDSIYIDVIDNGLGMDEVKLDELNKMLTSESIRESEHLGIANVNQRIRLYFGEEYGIKITSNEFVGTTVSIHIPRIE